MKESIMSMRVLISLSLPMAALLAGGCKTELCPKLYDKMKECAEGDKADKMPAKEEFVEKCTADQKKEKDEGTYSEEDEKAVAECLDKPDCEEMGKCMGEVSAKAYTRKKVAEIGKAKEADDVAKMKEACEFVSEDDEEIMAACKEVMPKIFEATTAEVVKARDAGEHDFGLCGDLERFAKVMGGDAEAKAKVTCEESQAGESVKKALEKAAANVAAKEADVPYECKAALEDLGKLDSEWAKTKQSEVANACYVDLGKVIMAAKVPDMKYVCDFRVEEVITASKTHNLEDAELTEWIDKAMPLCKEKTG
jgi:hypothetical protein